MILERPYSKDLFEAFLKDFLPDYANDQRAVRTPDKSILTKVTQLGTSQDTNLTVLEAECEETDSNKRIAITQAAFRVLRDHGIRNAIIAFHDGADQWRLSLLTSTLELKNGKVVKKDSNPRRYSYLVGIGSKSNTPHKYLIEKGPVTDIKSLQERFSVEVVNRQFYESIAELFTKLVGGDRGKTKHPGVLKINGQLSQDNEHQEFAVRLIGRIIFCWFLKEKKSTAGVPIVPDELLSLYALESHSDYYHSILGPLFFELLNKRLNNRHESLRQGAFATVPYLNGGLFSPQATDYYQQNSFTGGNPGIVLVPDDWFRELFTILEQYNFTVDENTSYDVELSIDPEMLGRIFENLLAEINPETGESARKSTGSFYTPREIVDYMVDSSLLEYLKSKTSVDEEKLRAIISWGQQDDKEHPLTEMEKKNVVDSLASLTILDPACGSGAFPIGVLQKVVYILQQVDEKAEVWLENQLKYVTSPELRRDIEEKYRSENYDWLRKLGVIRESIFGVDIQTVATEIAKLRCFLTLIIEEVVDDDRENRGIRPLPNLDFKFVTANSLIGLPDSSSNAPTLFEDKSHIDRLKQIRNSYFGADADERSRLQLEFKDLQLTMFKSRIAASGGTSDLYNTLSDWNPFSHDNTDWFDPEWMFGLDNFDIVIANPPYVDSETMVKVMPDLRDTYKSTYSVAKGNWDLYIIFYGLALRLLDKDGIGCFISPNQWLTLKYGQALRDHLCDKIISFADMRAYADFSAGVNTFVTTFINSARLPGDKVEYRLFASDGRYSINNMSVKELPSLDNYGILTSAHYDIVSKINSHGKKASALFRCGTSFIVNEYYMIVDIIKDNDAPDPSLDFKLLNTGALTNEITKTKWGTKEIKHINKYSFPVVNKQDFKNMFPRKVTSQDTPKVIVSESSGIKVFVDEDGQYLADKVTIPVIPHDEKELWTIGALLNSRLFHWYYDQVYTAGGMMGTTVNGAALEAMPIPDNPYLQKLGKLVNDKGSLGDGRVDSLIYQAYCLTLEEIAIIENSVSDS